MRQLVLRVARGVRMTAAAPLVFAAAASAQLPPCSNLPIDEREPARLAGRCAGLAPIIDMRPPAPAPRETRLPDVVGMSFDEARSRLTGFEVQRAYRSSVEPGGTILAQEPAAGALLAPGATVRLAVSDGSQLTVPRVIGINVNEARQRLAARGDLRTQTVVVTSNTAPGLIVAQQPAEGAPIARGGIVRLQVSAGPPGPPGSEVLEVPSVVGMPSDRALEALSRFRVQIVPQTSARPAGTVLKQTPTGRVRADSDVMIVVSGGRQTEIYDMPQIVGRSAADADRLLAEFALERQAVPSAEPRGQVLAQNPAPGAGVMPGSIVRIQVSDGSLVRVPEVVEQTLADARARVAEIRGVRLVVADGSGGDARRIAWQQPLAGAEVVRGSDLIVGFARPTWAFADRITGLDSGRGNLGPTALGVLFALILFVMLFALWRRRPMARAAVVHETPPEWLMAARVERPHAPGATVQGATPRGPEIGLAARLERGPTALVSEDERR
jgi:beta-lactam-binding protein with PASTA domain